ncbi:MAG: 3-dehydroquinate synthase [Treponema sp.]|nr:3-dehydroquinate synthase [Treponema sp.]
MQFNFGTFQTTAHITPTLPGIDEIAKDFNAEADKTGEIKSLLICDTNTFRFAEKIRGTRDIPVCTLKPGESQKDWQSVEAILRCAGSAHIGRDGLFIGIGGGVVTDISAFAASIYMRGCALALISTTLLGMVDASLGGKTGFDLFGIKNLAGTFYPAGHVYVPLESLASLPPAEWKSGMAELIKTAVLEGDDFLTLIEGMSGGFTDTAIAPCIERAVRYKGRIVEEDPLEKGSRRMLLNLGHTFGHALEAAVGLGRVSHGEAVAWGIARSCELGLSLGVCPPQRAKRIMSLLKAFDYETAAPHPLAAGVELIQALGSDKKKRRGKLVFIVPDEKSARPITVDSPDLMNTISKIIEGDISFL